jgi:hypothetical protein
MGEAQEAPYLRQFALQCAAVLIVLGLAWPYCLFRQQAFPWFESSFLIGTLAFLLACLSHQYWWWRLMHALFAPALAFFSTLKLAPEWYLLAFILSFLVYRGALTSRVPLYLSSRKTIETLSGLLAREPARNFIDLGAGAGGLARALAQEHRGLQVHGVENSLLPWFIGFLRTRGQPNCHLSLGSFWDVPLAGYEFVYAFLSPAPMARLWLKLKREMPAGALFISNGFCVPGVEAEARIEVDDARKTRLYCYRL